MSGLPPTRNAGQKKVIEMTDSKSSNGNHSKHPSAKGNKSTEIEILHTRLIQLANTWETLAKQACEQGNALPSSEEQLSRYHYTLSVAWESAAKDLRLVLVEVLGDQLDNA